MQSYLCHGCFFLKAIKALVLAATQLLADLLARGQKVLYAHKYWLTLYYGHAFCLPSQSEI